MHILNCTSVHCNIKWRKIEIKIKINKRTLEPWKIPPLQIRGSCPLDPRKFSNSGALACHFPRFFSIISLHIWDSDEVLNIRQCCIRSKRTLIIQFPHLSNYFQEPFQGSNQTLLKPEMSSFVEPQRAGAHDIYEFTILSTSVQHSTYGVD